MKPKKSKILSIGYYVALVPLILLALLFIGAALPGFGEYKVMTVLSGSMKPTIKEGSVIVVLESESYKEGDVITFKSGRDAGIPTTHRIENVKVEGGEVVYITKGDANPVVDISETGESDVIGKVIFNISYLGYVVEFTKTPLGFVIIIIIPAVVIIIGEIKKIYTEIKRKNKENV